MAKLVDRERHLERTNKEEAISGLFTHVGWTHLLQLLDDKKRQKIEQLKTADFNSPAEIAKLQGEIKMIEEIADKPKYYHNKHHNNK